jgi:hypothetical protein
MHADHDQVHRRLVREADHLFGGVALAHYRLHLALDLSWDQQPSSQLFFGLYQQIGREVFLFDGKEHRQTR